MSKSIPQKSKLKVLTFNTFGTPLLAHRVTARFKKIAEIIDESNADIVCLQEVSTYYSLHILKKYLNKYPVSVYKRFILGPKGGLVIFSKHTVENISFHKFSKLGNFSDSTFYAHIIRNGVLGCKIKSLPITIMNTHLTTDYEFDWSPKNKLYSTVQAQVHDAALLVKRNSTRDNTIIITGDFNMGKNTKLYNEFLEQTNAEDVFSNYTSPTYTSDKFKYKFRGKKSERIDYIFISDKTDQLEIISTTQLFEKPITLPGCKKSYLSDHISLLTEINCRV